MELGPVFVNSISQHKNVADHVLYKDDVLIILLGNLLAPETAISMKKIMHLQWKYNQVKLLQDAKC